MNGFAVSPACSQFGDRRTRCDCGYAMSPPKPIPLPRPTPISQRLARYCVGLPLGALLLAFIGGGLISEDPKTFRVIVYPYIAAVIAMLIAGAVCGVVALRKLREQRAARIMLAAFTGVILSAAIFVAWTLAFLEA
ncbi:MAG: hypothetical protein ACE5KM_14075 [Planctomycetaceae bacterium]